MKKEGTLKALIPQGLKTWARGHRVLLMAPDMRRRLQALDLPNKYCCEDDPLYFVTQKFYLSRKLTLAQRVECAISHYGYEQRNRGTIYHNLIYRSSGLVLWQKTVDGVHYELRLTVETAPRHEGDLSVTVSVDDTKICVMSFSYVNTSVFGLRGDVAMFITRNQTFRNEGLNRFRAAFKQNSPPYFCLWALSGIAMASDMVNLYAIKHDAQVSYDDRYADGFKNSYGNFWGQFGAKDVDHQAYRLVVPLPLTPIKEVKHRARAIARRCNWEQVSHDTRQVMRLHTTSSILPPLPETTRLTRH